MKISRVAIAVVLLTIDLHVARAADQTKPVKVFILAGQSNMEGQAVADLDGKDYNDGKGTLKALLKGKGKSKGDALGKAMVKLLSPKKQSEPAKPTSHSVRKLEGWTIRVDDRLLRKPNDVLGSRALRFLEGKLSDIKMVLPKDKVKKLQTFIIVLDLTHGKLGPMQYHPSAGWLKANGYATDLAKCVHLPRAADVPTRRNVNEQPWVILHELAHAYHDQVLGFDEPRIKAVYEKYKKSGRGEKTLLFNGERVRHYALTDHKEFFAEMTEAYFGVNDFFPFNRAELKEAEPEIHALLSDIWESKPKKKQHRATDGTRIKHGAAR